MSAFLDGALGLTEIQVHTVTPAMFDVDEMGDVVTQSIQRSLAWGTDLIDEYMREVKSGMHTKIDDAYRYAKRGGYYYGTPDINPLNGSAVQAFALSAAISEVGGVDAIFDLYGDLHPGFAAYHKLFNEYGYNLSSNTIQEYSDLVGHTCYLYDMQYHYPEENFDKSSVVYQIGVGINQGKTPSRRYPAKTSTPIKAPILGSEYGVTIVYEWVDESGNILRGTDFIDLSPFIGEKYFQVITSTHAVDGKTPVGVWLYSPSEGRYPTLDHLFLARSENSGEYFPFIVFRREKENLSEKEYWQNQLKSSRRLMDRLNMDYDSINEQIHANEGIDDIESAILTLAVPAKSEHQADLEYLYRFFEDLYKTSFPENSKVTVDPNGFTKQNFKSGLITWADAGFDMQLVFTDIRRSNHIGKVAEKGKYAIEHSTHTVELLVSEGNLTESDKDYITNKYVKKSKDIPVISYCYQVFDGVYVKYSIIAPRMRFPIGGRKTEFLVDAEEFVIPLNMTLVEDMRWKTRNELYTRNLRFIINSKIVERLPWYATGIFKAFMFAAALAMAVVGAVNLVYTAIAIAEAATLTAALEIAGTFLAKLLLFKAVGIVLVKVLGPEYAFIASLALLMVGVAEFAGVDIVNGLVSPEILIGMVTGTTDAAQSEIKQWFAKYNVEYQCFIEESESRLKELEEMKKATNIELLDSPFKDRYMVPMYIPGETPDQYFNRTIHTGNVGTMAFKTVENFVASSLTLQGIERDPRIEVSIYG